MRTIFLILIIFFIFAQKHGYTEPKIIKKISEIENFTFDFEQLINNKKETGNCIISFNNKITDIIGTPEVGLGFVTYDNDRKYIGTYLCTNFKKRFDYGKRSFPYISKSIYLRYGFYYGLLQHPVFDENKYKTRYYGMLQIGVVKYLSFGLFK